MSQENVKVARRFHDHFDATGEPLWEVVDRDAAAWCYGATSALVPRWRA